jgi:hypothetical protein
MASLAVVSILHRVSAGDGIPRANVQKALVMPSRSSAQAELQERNVKAAKWRFILRNPAFRLDLNRFRNEAATNFAEAQSALTEGPFPNGVIEAETGDLSPETLPHYEAFYTDTSEYADPELLWRLIRPQDSQAIPDLHMGKGKRTRLDKTDFYCEVIDLYTGGLTIADISIKLGKPEPTVKSALRLAKKHAGLSAPRVNFNPDEHRATCPACQIGQDCREYEERFAQFAKRIPQDFTGPEDAYRKGRMTYVEDWESFDEKKPVGCRHIRNRGSADQQANRSIQASLISSVLW